MTGFFSNITFLNPWILAGLAALPALWYLLRITPPSPRLVILPTAKFLAGLIPADQTPSKTPWWIFLLRIAATALIIIALSGPVLNPSAGLGGSGPVRLVIDNGWASASVWNKEVQAARDALSQAAREGRTVYLLTTAPAPGEKKPAYYGPLSAIQAEGLLKGLKPLPWPADYAGAAALARQNKDGKNIRSYWFSHGLDEGHFTDLVTALQSQGGLNIFSPAPAQLPMILGRAETAKPGKFEMTLHSSPAAPPGQTIMVQAIDENGRSIDQVSVSLKSGQSTPVIFDTPASLKNRIAQIRLPGTPGAGTTYVLDDRYRKRTAGIITHGEESDPKPFIEARYYIRRALEPFTKIFEGSLQDVLKKKVSAIIMTDIGALPPDTLDALEKWVRGGGLLVRFAGTDMAQNRAGNDFLLPVALRGGERSLDGDLTWDKPKKVAGFSKAGSLYGIELREDIMVRRQMLAEPSADLEEKTWASLEDGTPLITASPLGGGLVVFIHTAATPDWSDLPLSGVFVEILQRIINLAGQTQSTFSQAGGAMEPLLVLDGMGRLQKPDNTVRPIASEDMKSTIPGPLHPPGLYGGNGQHTALNLGDSIKSLNAQPTLMVGAERKLYGQTHELELLPYILFAALALLLLDWAVIIAVSGGLRPLLRFGAVIFALLFLLPVSAQANDSDIKYADGFYMAYMRTGDAALDALSQRGLENLAAILRHRTSVEPDDVVGLNPETDMLIFFPIIYWPVTASQPPLSDAALSNIQNYLDHGGTILFDTRDGATGTDSVNAAHLAHLIGRLSVPALEPIPDNHVLLRSFYLLHDVPGRLNGGSLWVETRSAPGRDGVSSIILGSNDWAGAWSEGRIEPTFSGQTRQQELAFRFGVNAVMYALTGNYKEDQIHVKNILERLGQ